MAGLLFLMIKEKRAIRKYKGRTVVDVLEKILAISLGWCKDFPLYTKKVLIEN